MICLFVAYIALIASEISAATTRDTTIHVGDRGQMFIDERFLDRSHNVRNGFTFLLAWRFRRPEPGSVVVRAEKQCSFTPAERRKQMPYSFVWKGQE